jgi:hypothetical protein
MLSKIIMLTSTDDMKAHRQQHATSPSLSVAATANQENTFFSSAAGVVSRCFFYKIVLRTPPTFQTQSQSPRGRNLSQRGRRTSEFSVKTS